MSMGGAEQSCGRSWIGVGLDGTLAVYDRSKGATHIGDPVPEMVARVKRWISEGLDVRIFTARVAPAGTPCVAMCSAINTWLLQHLGRALPITCVRDDGMVELWDHRAVQVVTNTGQRIDGCSG